MGRRPRYVRVPYAETSVYKLPPSVSNADAVLLSDILPSGHEIGVQNGHVRAGDVVAVIGVGPVGLAAIMTAQLYGPSRVIAIDIDEKPPGTVAGLRRDRYSVVRRAGCQAEGPRAD
jgi:alcohol dehydrogenase